MRPRSRDVAWDIDWTLRPDEMVTVEDSFTGAASAHEAGMRVFAISSSGAPVPPAEAAARRLDELPDLVLPWPLDATRGGRTPDGL